MIIAPVTVDDTAGGTTLVSAAEARKAKVIIVQLEAGEDDIALAFDGGAVALTFANGLLLLAGTERVIEMDKASFTNGVKAITAAMGSASVRVHVIE